MSNPAQILGSSPHTNIYNNNSVPQDLKGMDLSSDSELEKNAETTEVTIYLDRTEFRAYMARYEEKKAAFLKEIAPIKSYIASEKQGRETYMLEPHKQQAVYEAMQRVDKLSRKLELLTDEVCKVAEATNKALRAVIARVTRENRDLKERKLQTAREIAHLEAKDLRLSEVLRQLGLEP